MTRKTWDRAELLALKYWEMPSLRMRWQGRNVVGRVAELRDANPWVESHQDGRWVAMQISWGLLLELLNDPYCPPLELEEERDRWSTVKV